MEIYERRGDPIALDQGVLRLEEAREYFLAPPIASPGDASTEPEAFLGAMRLNWSAAENAFELPISHWIGAQVLRVVAGGREWEVPVEVVPRPNKLSPESWVALLSDLEEWLPSLSVGALPGLHGSVVSGGPRAALLVEAVLPLIPALQDAVEAVVSSPRYRDDRVEALMPAHRVRRIEPVTLSFLQRAPEAWNAISERWDSTRAAPRPPMVPARIGISLLDHPANAYVSWLVSTIARDLGVLADVVQKSARNNRVLDREWASWCEARSENLSAASRKLMVTWRRSWLSKISARPPTDAALAVVADDPLYGRVHRLARRFRSTMFRREAGAGALQTTSRPSYELFELWTFLRVQKLLAELLPDHGWSSYGLAPLASLGEPLDGAQYKATGPASTLRLMFNPTFPGYLARGNAARYSISKERRPDLVLTWEGAGRAAWWCLDAKYRVERSNVADAFSSAHLYRDSLRWQALGGHCEAAVLLVPAKSLECAPWFEPDFVAENRVGVFEVTPGRGETASLREWLRAELRI